MSSNLEGVQGESDLRLRALRQLRGRTTSHEKQFNAGAALGVLYELASSPTTAGAALTLLHELQVHQVELDLQDEELRRSRAELEVTLARQTQLYDFAPVAYLTVDRDTAVRELNLTAADMLGSERGPLLGRSLDSFLEPRSGLALRAMLDRLTDSASREVCTLQLMAPHGKPRHVHASATRDPKGQHFLVALIDVAEHSG